jgi:radical SAM superfamily enzyme YgiQ (UPF0313 family)
MSDVLLGQAYYLYFDPKLWAAMQPYPPLGTLYAASVLRSHGFDVALFDAMLARSESEWADALDHHRPKWAVIYEDDFNYLSKMCLLRMREAAFVMIRAARARGCKVVLAGADASDHPEKYLEAGADHVIVGEAEPALLDLLTQRELVQIAPRRSPIKALDALPFPAWDMIDIERYRRLWIERHGYFSINMVSTRGCPYHCNWCAKPIWGQRYNVRSPENVVEEMKQLRDRARPDQIAFADDIFGLEPRWIARFADALDKAQVRVPFKCLSRADLLLRPGEIDALSRAGCEIVWLGAESGSQKILDAMDKGTTVDQIYAAADALHRAGIRVAFFLQFGYPGETIEDIELTLQMVRACRPDEIGVSVSYPLPGTKFHEAVKAQLGAKRNWVDSSDLAMMYQGPFTTEFYRKLHAIVHKEHRIASARIDLVRSARHPSSLTPRHVRRAAGLVYRALTLPFDRRELMRLSRLPHTGVDPLPRLMRREDAAQPSQQDGSG